MSNSLKIFGAVFNNVEGIKAKDENNVEYVYKIDNALAGLLDNTLTEFDYNGSGYIPPFFAQNKTALTSINAPNVTVIGAHSFQGCVNVTSCNFNSLTTIETGNGGYTLESLGKGHMSVLNLPNLQTCSASYGMGNMGTSSVPLTLVCPKLSSISSDFWRGSTFDALDLGGDFSSLPVRALYQGSGCKKLILRKSDGVVALSATSSVGVGSNGGLTNSSIVFVPQALISTYESNTNWAAAQESSGHNFVFSPIEGSQYENAYADGTPIT